MAIFSCLAFVYSISFFFEKEESGQKVLSFLIFFILIILAIVLIFMASLELEIDLSFLLNQYNFTVFDITPITSFMLSSFRLTFSYYFFEAMYIPDNYEKLDFGNFGSLYRPSHYAVTSLIVQIINIIIYSGLLLLLESGVLKGLYKLVVS